MNPILTSSSGSGENEPFRIARLEKVIKIYNIQVEDLDDHNLNKITSLHDHKGELSVTWNHNPSEDQKANIKLIWELQNEYNVVHEVEIDK